MKAAILYNRYNIKVEEVDEPIMRTHDQVLVKVRVAWLSGADLNLFVGNIKFPYPMIPGYCFSGVVEERGEASNFQVGERVCGLDFGSFGAFAEYMVVYQDRIYKLPKRVSFEEGALIEPVALASKSLRLTKPLMKENVLILGQGSLGLIHTQLFKKAGAKVFVTDLIPSRLNLSKRIGADYAFNVMECDTLKEVSNTTERGIDIVVEATGSSNIVELLEKLVKKRLRIVLFSIWNPVINQFKTLEKEIQVYKISGACREDCIIALKMISDRTTNLEVLIDKRVSLENIEEAYNFALNPSQGEYAPKAIGAIINP